MRPWRAILLFPALPGSAAPVLPRASAFAAPGPPLLLLVFLAARGCRAADAALTAAGIFLLVLGAGAGGALASALARRILEGAPRRGVQVFLVFAAWAVLLLVLALFVSGSALAAGLLVLVWGVVAGIRVLAPDTEPGHGLVASCAGTMGAIVGILLTAMLVHERMVLVMASPSGRGTLLVRRGEVREPQALVVARDPVSTTLFLARKGPLGLVPEGAPPRGPPGGWTEIGRVFFYLGAGAPWGRAAG